MKTEINNENKAKFFGQYWGQCVFKHLHTSIETHVNESDLKLPLFKHSGVLELKPLSLISDEDAVEVVKIYGLNEFSIRPKSRYGIKDFGSKHGELTLFSDLSFGGGSRSSWEADYFVKPFVVDTLRSKGYALPWMGLSVEEMVDAGWIKLTES